jgi:hypothetical protein
VHDGAGQGPVVGVDHQGVPVVADQHGGTVRAQHADGFGQGRRRVGEFVEHLVGAVTGDRGVGQREPVGVADAQIEVGPAAPRLGDDVLVGVDPDRSQAALFEFGRRSSGPAADIDHRRTRRQRQQFVAAPPQGGGAGQRVGQVELADLRH